MRPITPEGLVNEAQLKETKKTERIVKNAQIIHHADLTD